MQGIKRNVGRIDRAIRFMTGAGLIYLSLPDSGLIQNHVARYILAALGALNLASALISHCPLYIIAGIDTHKRSTSKKS